MSTNPRFKPTAKERLLIYQKTNGKCLYCMAVLSLETMHCDHLYPVCKGGNSLVINFVPSCKSCNLRKSSKLVTEEAKTRTVYQTKVVIKKEIVKSDDWKIYAEVWKAIAISWQKSFESELFIRKTRAENIEFNKIIERIDKTIADNDIMLEAIK